MERTNWIEFFNNVEETMDDGNMIGAVNEVKTAMATLELNEFTLELYEDFFVSLYTHGTQRLNDLKSKMQYDRSEYEDAFSATEAAFRRAIDSLKAINLLYEPRLEEDIRAHKMMLDVYTALITYKYGSGEKSAQRLEVFNQFDMLFVNGNRRQTIFFLSSIQLFIDFCEDENLEDQIPPLINQKFTSYNDLRRPCSVRYRHYANNLIRSCDIHLDEGWKTQANKDWKQAVQTGDQRKCLESILAFIEMEFKTVPIELDMWQALRSAALEVIGGLLDELDRSGGRGGLIHIRRQYDYYNTGMLTLYESKNHPGVPIYDKWYCNLLRAELSVKRGGRTGHELFEKYFVEVAENAEKFADKPETVIDFLYAIKSHIKCFCVSDEDFLFPVLEGLKATLNKIGNNPVSQQVQTAIDDVKKLIECEECL